MDARSYSQQTKSRAGDDCTVNTYKVYFIDGYSVTVKAMNEDEARYKAMQQCIGTISNVVYII